MQQDVLKVIVASKNPVKISAVESGLKRMFPNKQLNILGISVPSGVADQPITDEETLLGATQRAANASKLEPDADLWVGLEGGVCSYQGELAAFAWIVVKSKTMEGRAKSGMFFLPKAVSELVEQGVELGIADDMVFNKSNSKQAGGAIGILTENALTRKELYEQAVVMALVPYKNLDLYPVTAVAGN